MSPKSPSVLHMLRWIWQWQIDQQIVGRVDPWLSHLPLSWNAIEVNAKKVTGDTLDFIHGLEPWT